MSAPVTKILKIKGHVQGVGFRYSMQSKASELGVTGWVRNCRDSSVEAVVQGEEKNVQDIIEWAWRGPNMAHVTDIEITESSGSFSEFSIRDSI